MAVRQRMVSVINQKCTSGTVSLKWDNMHAINQRLISKPCRVHSSSRQIYIGTWYPRWASRTYPMHLKLWMLDVFPKIFLGKDISRNINHSAIGQQKSLDHTFCVVDRSGKGLAFILIHGIPLNKKVPLEGDLTCSTILKVFQVKGRPENNDTNNYYQNQQAGSFGLRKIYLRVHTVEFWRSITPSHTRCILNVFLA